jgi:hypothetical protein
MWEQAVASVDAPEGLDLTIGSLVLKGVISPVSLFDGSMTLLDLNYIANLVKYKETVNNAYNALLEHEAERQRLMRNKHGF